GSRELEVIAVPGAVAVHARQEDLAGTKVLDGPRPFDRVFSRGPPTAVRVDAPPSLGAFRSLALGIDGHHDALAAEGARRLPNQRRLLEGRGVQGDLVGAGAQQRADVLE